MIKKLFSALFFSACLLLFAACGKTDVTSNSDLLTKKTEPVASGSDFAESAKLPASDSDLTDSSLHQTATLYLPNENSDGLEEVEAPVTYKKTSLFQAMMDSKMLPETWELIDFSIQSNGKTIDSVASATDIHGTELIGYLDLNQAFLESLKEADKAQETTYLASIVNTFIFNYNLGGLMITVEGEPLETEQYSCQEPMTPFVFN